MCRRSTHCTELGTDSAAWSTTSPLPPPAWVDGQLELFVHAVSALAMDDLPNCIAALRQIRNAEIQRWYIEHGQTSGMYRVNHLGLSTPATVEAALRDPRRSPKRYEREVFTRDGYRCRYCGIRLVANETLKAFAGRVGPDLFAKGRTNLDTHGIILAFKPVADHVLPWGLGGRTEPSNLVSSCGACNYGKFNYTLEQMGLASPFARPPQQDRWDGLSAYADALK